MEGRCDTDPLDAADDVCSTCGGEFCDACLLYPPGRKTKPVCKKCAINNSGIRGGVKTERRSGRRDAKKRRQELVSTKDERAARSFVFFDEAEDSDFAEAVSSGEAGTDDSAEKGGAIKRRKVSFGRSKKNEEPEDDDHVSLEETFGAPPPANADDGIADSGEYSENELEEGENPSATELLARLKEQQPVAEPIQHVPEPSAPTPHGDAFPGPRGSYDWQSSEATNVQPLPSSNGMVDPFDPTLDPFAIPEAGPPATPQLDPHVDPSFSEPTDPGSIAYQAPTYEGSSLPPAPPIVFEPDPAPLAASPEQPAPTAPAPEMAAPPPPPPPPPAPEPEPEAFEPETFEPEIVEAVYEPEAFEPEAFEPEAFEPETVEAVYEPEATFEAQAFENETVEPVYEPDTFERDTFEPDTFEPDTFEPDTFEADTFEPDTFEPVPEPISEPTDGPATMAPSGAADTDADGNWVPPALRGMAPKAEREADRLPKRRNSSANDESIPPALQG